jgi:hypothetical protein
MNVFCFVMTTLCFLLVTNTELLFGPDYTSEMPSPWVKLNIYGVKCLGGANNGGCGVHWCSVIWSGWWRM